MAELAKPLTIPAVRPGTIFADAFPPQLFYFNDLNRKFKQLSNQIVVTGAEALNMDIDNILECPKGSFMFNRDFGSRIKSVLFEPMNDITAHKLLILFIQAIETWEPRVKVIFPQSIVTPYYDCNLYVANIFYRILSTGEIASYSRSMLTQTGQ